MLTFPKQSIIVDQKFKEIIISHITEGKEL